jgi:hypothetical protein
MNFNYIQDVRWIDSKCMQNLNKVLNNCEQSIDNKKFNYQVLNNYNYGDRTYGDRTYGDRTYGDRTYGDRTYGDRTYGNRTYGDRTYGDRTYGNRTYEIKNKVTTESILEKENIIGRKPLDPVSPYHNPKKVNLSFINLSQVAGAFNSDDILRKVPYKNTKFFKVVSSDGSVELNLNNYLNTKIDETISEYNFLARGSQSVVYNVTPVSIGFSKYMDRNLILKLFTKNIDSTIVKYKEDINNLSEIKENFVDILYYGKIKINETTFYYVITPIYETDFWKMEYHQKIAYAKNLISLIRTLRNKKYFLNDLSSTNIGYNGSKVVLIDYDEYTLSQKLNLANGTIPNFMLNADKSYPYLERIKKGDIITFDNEPKLNKYYSLGLGDVFYHLFFTHINAVYFYPNFVDFGYTIYNNKKEKYLTLNNPSKWLEILIKQYNNCHYVGISDILYNSQGKGLFSLNMKDIPDLDVIEKLFDNINMTDIKSFILKPNVYEMLKKYNTISSGLELTKYGYRQKDFINPNLYQFNFFANFEQDKIMMIKYYLTYNRWEIISYENDNDPKVKDNTLKYALQAVGCLHSIEFDDNGPIIKVHLSKDFLEKYGNYYDNCRIMENNILTLIWWCINMTDLFNLIYLRDKNYVKNKKFYINIVDHPIDRKDGQHPFVEFRTGKVQQKIPITVRPDPNLPLYCWPAKKNYNDIGLPFHDMWMFFLEREFSSIFNMSTYLEKYKFKDLNQDYITKYNKAIFRGSYTNCVSEDGLISKTVRINAHLRSLQDDSKFLDAVVVSSAFNYINYSKGQIYNENIPYLNSKDKFMNPNEQIRFKYVLNLDGFASAFRIIQEMYYNSCMIIPDSEYTDVLRDILVPWKHYVPCNPDLSNVINTIKWCTQNDDKVLAILKNLRELRDAVVTFDNMLALTTAKFVFDNKKQINLDNLKNFNSYNQQEFKPLVLPIPNDIITPLGKTGKLSFKNDIGEKTLEEDIYYEKYMKYKKKYTSLKQQYNV